ncbi:caspase-2 [Trichonephila inaurata madagascariensis]|uniref:Caspase-2 n=1 Tax=Trichonephila inaurata madagascariensis TaxID=2747483 RepID=A0A8X7CCA6_9ARAC|nr:caspase-2 [Trichonephila inaurata madagascariensis]
MDSEFRNLILKKKEFLKERINLNQLKPYLVKHKIFTNSMLRDIFDSETDCDFFVELTTRGPDAFSKFRQVLKEAGYVKEAETLKANSSSFFKKRLCYKMNSKPIGCCLIINNVDFDYLECRKGSDEDAVALEDLFRKLGYEVTSKKNLTGEKMKISLKKFKEQNKWSFVDSCVLIILSHGDSDGYQDIIYGTDSTYVKKADIYQMFDNANCESLQFKPKMFFFQACRGTDEDSGGYVTEATDAAKKVKIPSMSDLLVAHSTLPNHLSYRDLKKGSWFCQDLVQVFSEDYETQDLETMLKTVAQKLENRLSFEHKKQVLHIDNFGFKAAVYFCMDNVADFCSIWNPRNT